MKKLLRYLLFPSCRIYWKKYRKYKYWHDQLKELFDRSIDHKYCNILWFVNYKFGKESQNILRQFRTSRLRSSLKMVFSKTLQNSREKLQNSAESESSLIKLQAWTVKLYFKKDFGTGVFQPPIFCLGKWLCRTLQKKKGEVKVFSPISHQLSP